MGRPRVLAASTALIVALTACGGAPQPGADPPEDATSAPPPAVTSPQPSTPSGSRSPAAEARAFAFEAELVAGGTYDASQLAGRDVAIWFWAPW